MRENYKYYEHEKVTNVFSIGFQPASEEFAIFIIQSKNSVTFDSCTSAWRHEATWFCFAIPLAKKSVGSVKFGKEFLSMLSRIEDSLSCLTYRICFWVTSFNYVSVVIYNPHCLCDCFGLFHFLYLGRVSLWGKEEHKTIKSKIKRYIKTKISF